MNIHGGMLNHFYKKQLHNGKLCMMPKESEDELSVATMITGWTNAGNQKN